MTPRCGYVALVGAPNAGKSTLMNTLVGAKVSIVTHKVQTTRMRVLGIAMRDDSQIIFVDTPGIFQPKDNRRLEQAMVKDAWSALKDADILALLVDASRGVDDDTQFIINHLKDTKRQAILILNKIDLVKRETLLALTEKLNRAGVFTDTFMISALKDDGTQVLLDHLAKTVPEGPWMYPEDQISDLPLKLLAAEITREKLFLRLHDELPYATTIETESWEEEPDGALAIGQVIIVARDSQKPIVLGKGGRQIKKIGMAARKELEKLLDRHIRLNLFVKVRENWAEDPERYAMMGLDFHKKN